MKKVQVLISGALVAVFAAGALVITPVLAQNDADDPVSDDATSTSNSRSGEMRGRAQAAREAAKQRLEQVRQNRAERLGERLLLACEKREQRINNIIQRSATQSEKHLSVFQTIQERVEQFKENKNLSVDGYDALVEAANEKATAALEAVEAAKVTTFECDDEGTGRQFSGLVRETVKNQHAALKEYRKAVVDLIKGVKQSIDGSDDQTDESEEG